MTSTEYLSIVQQPLAQTHDAICATIKYDTILHMTQIYIISVEYDSNPQEVHPTENLTVNNICPS